MKVKAIYLLLLNLFFLNSFSFEQEGKIKDLVRLNKEYSKRDELSMIVVYQGYSSYTSREPMDTLYGIVKQQGENIYNQIGVLESLHNELCNVVVDEDDKTINIMKIISKSEAPELDKLMQLVEKYMNNSNSITQVTLDKIHREYRIVIPGNSEYSEIRIVYDYKNWLVKKMILYYSKEESVNQGGKKEKPRLVITYKDIVLHPTFMKNEFKLERFVKKEGDRYVGVGKYFDFKVISQF